MELDTVFMIAQIGIFLLLLMGFFALFKSLILRESVKKSVDRIYSTLASKDAERLDRLDEERRKYGSISGTDGGFWGRFLEKVDNLLVYSGWSIRYTWLNTSTFILLYVVGGGCLFLVGYTLSGNVLVGFILVLLVGIIPIYRMSLAADNAYKSVESQLVLCVNMVANLGTSTDSIVVVLEEVAPFMTNPLRTSIRRAISTANLTGKESEGIRQLCREVEHPLFVQFIRHLEVSAKNSADFRVVARDFAGQVDTAIKASNRLKEIFNGGKASILTLMVVGAIMMYMIATFDGSGLIAVFVAMSQSLFGILVLGYLIVIYAAAIFYMVLGMRR